MVHEDPKGHVELVNGKARLIIDKPIVEEVKPKTVKKAVKKVVKK